MAKKSLAVYVFSEKIAFQKLNYILWAPLADHWQLVKDACEYKYSSARYYEMNKLIFAFKRFAGRVLK